MKKILSIVLTIFIMFSIGTMTACKDETTNDSSNSISSTDTSSDSSKPTTLTESQLKSIAVRELYDSLSSLAGRYGDWNYKIDPSNCRYSIGSIRQVTYSTYEVNGVCYFYDKYGSLTTKYNDGSGGYSESFTVTIYSSGNASISWSI